MSRWPSATIKPVCDEVVYGLQVNRFPQLLPPSIHLDSIHLSLDQIFCNLHAVEAVYFLLHVGIRPLVGHGSFLVLKSCKLLVSFLFGCSLTKMQCSTTCSS